MYVFFKICLYHYKDICLDGYILIFIFFSPYKEGHVITVVNKLKHLIVPLVKEMLQYRVVIHLSQWLHFVLTPQ